MTLAKLIQKGGLLSEAATAIPAIHATQAATVAKIATVAVANPPDTEPEPPATEARQKVIAMLKARPDLRYALATDDADADPVCLVLGIRNTSPDGEALITCALYMGRDRYDPFLLLDLLNRNGDIIQ